ncbi:F5J5.1 [Cucumis melo var. makuwa]|uniref:F5J5.1 n=1 Tax=Cucumis melo var. makuwa TaxID=1194695 RepID=A0A5D3C212_CUCMM|nr:F5J5.1 [Cucumis melo var. makuwa]
MSNDSINECTLKRKWEEDRATIVHQQTRIQCLMEENQSFLSSIATLKAELKEARNQFEKLTKSVRMLTNGTQKLDDLIDQGRRCIGKRGMGFSGRKATGNETKIMFIRESVTQNSQVENATLPVKVLNRRKRHMTENAEFLLELSECNAGSVVLGDGGKGRIIGKGTINHPAKAVKAEAIVGLPLLSFNSRECCSNCPAGKQVKSSHKPTNQSSTTRILELLHIDLMGLMQTKSLKGKKYALNGVVEQKNRTLQEMASVMLHAKDLPIYFWAEALNTTCYIHNRGNHSQQIKPAGSKHSSLIEDNENSPSYSNVDSMTIPVEATSVDHSEVGTNEASASAYQSTNKMSGVTTRKKERRDYAKMVANVCYTSTMEPTIVTATLTDEHWLLDMQKEFYNLSEIRSSFGKTFAPIARLEAIMLLLTFACFRKFKLFQMDVKSAFLNGYLSEEVYVAQLKGFVDPVHRDHVYKLRKALYGFKQAPKACMVGELTFFLGFQIKQEEIDIFFSQEKYAKNLVSKFGMDKAKLKRTPAATNLKMTKNIARQKIDSSLYRSIIRSLLYLTTSRPNITFAVGVMGRCWSLSTTSIVIHRNGLIESQSPCIYSCVAILMPDYSSWLPCCSQLIGQVLHLLPIIPLQPVFPIPWLPHHQKNATTTKGKHYKGIPTKHSYEKIRRSVATSKEGHQSLLTSPVRSTHSRRSLDPVSPVPIKKEVPKSSPPCTFHLSASSFVPRTRGSIEIVVLDSDFSDSKDNVVLSTLLQGKDGHPTDSSPTPLKPTQVSCSRSRVASPPKEVLSRTTNHGTSSAAPDSPHATLPTDEEEASEDTDEDYAHVHEETPVPEESLMSTKDPISSPDK